MSHTTHVPLTEELGAGEASRAGLRIANVRVHKLTGDLTERFGWSLGWTGQRRATLVEVTTEDGLTGWGDGGYGGDRLLRNPELVIGRSPFEVEGIWESLRVPPRHQNRRGESVCGGLDVALWDLIGKALRQPVCRILGHRYRSRIQPYCTALYRKDWPDPAAGLAEEARHWKSQGFRLIKMKNGYGPDEDVRLVRAVRQAIGDDMGLAADANCAYDAGTAEALGRRLEDCHLAWWEEPILADDLAGYARLKRSLGMPLAGGETLGADTLVRDYVQPRLIDIVQPEVEIVGLTGGRRIAQSCWLNHVRMIPHNWGTAIRTVSILHWLATLPPLTEALEPPPVLFELDCTESPFRDAVIRESIRVEDDGCIAVPLGPGLGVEVIRDAVEEFRTELISIP